ncbi:glycosyltransferase family 2 protein [Salegentibacter sp. F188]|uniref:Glycosyltransferase family 2 protein n=1 Tax=Autumnicola patrickiae TaxID=3075591 RepID=A0ABU3DY03_9FLAO|nr:glycosyltransferase family 2 protein [Salegentibacter sp. F188]MDT0688606.1 glycosyltransferase family 2 protein [Salegentibacter sp. F188]
MNDSKILFSIIVPTFNRADIIKEAIKSVLEQSYDNWECLVIDDGSTDGTERIINSFKDSRIKYYYKSHEERSKARNFGIAIAEGEYICFLDSDDIYFPNHLVALLEKINKVNFVIGIFHTELNICQKQSIHHEKWFENLNNKQVANFILQGKSLYINAICVSREAFNYNKFPDQFSYWEDQHLWLRLLIKFPFFSVNQVTTQWNITGSSSVNTNFQEKPLKKMESYLRCITDVEEKKEITACRFLAKEDFKNLKREKASKYIRHSIYKGKYLFAIRQYIICLKFLGLLDISSAVVKIVHEKYKL